MRGDAFEIKFFSNLNRALRQIEQQIVDRAIVFLEDGERRLKEDPSFTIDYFVEALVEYYINVEGYPCHQFRTGFDYERTIIEKDYGFLLDIDDGRDCHREGANPVLDQPYCYLLRDLIGHSQIHRGAIYQIQWILVDVIYRPQKGIKMNSDGSSRLLVHTEDGWN